MSDKRQPGLSRGGDGPKQYQPMSGCFTQLAWSAGGFVVVLMLWVMILQQPKWTLSIRDVLYWATVLGMIGARHIDVVRHHGRTTTGEPATARDVRNYAVALLVGAGLSWCIAQAFHL